MLFGLLVTLVISETVPPVTRRIYHVGPDGATSALETWQCVPLCGTLVRMHCPMTFLAVLLENATRCYCTLSDHINGQHSFLQLLTFFAVMSQVFISAGGGHGAAASRPHHRLPGAQVHTYRHIFGTHTSILRDHHPFNA